MRIDLKVDRRTSNKEEKLRRGYSIKAKGFEIKELTQKIAGKPGKLKHYKALVTEYRQNKLLSCIQKDYMKNLVVNTWKLVIHYRQTMLRNLESDMG